MEKNKKKISYEPNEGETNDIIIAGREIEVYEDIIITAFQKYDQIIILSTDFYRPKAEHIIRRFETFGILPIQGRILWEQKEEEIPSEKYGKPKRMNVNRITLSKLPELFKFTKLD